ncbi:hypothetical protein QE152_g9840 [Popillia japonica]|uniref:Uncharacterized protein n=1 Tax=Popillia japonica TaxID=7064 RepID=A0AAW1LXE5_POPJA
MESTDILASSKKENARTENVKETQQNEKSKRKRYTKNKSKTNANLQKENLLGDRHWSKEEIDEDMPDYQYFEVPVEEEFMNCKSATDVYLHLLGRAIDDIVFQSNLYATQHT